MIPPSEEDYRIDLGDKDIMMTLAINRDPAEGEPDTVFQVHKDSGEQRLDGDEIAHIFNALQAAERELMFGYIQDISERIPGDTETFKVDEELE